MKSSSERIQCVNGCGNLTHDSHDKLTVNMRIALVVGGILVPLLLLNYNFGTYSFWLFVGSVMAFFVGIFGNGKHNDFPYFICKVCKGGMLDSKSLIEKFGKYNAGLIEYSLKKADFGEKKCPICEEKMKIIPLEYSTIHFVSGLPIPIPIPSGGKIELDGCHDCSMIWFDSAEMDYVASSTKLKRDRMTEKTSRSSNKSIFECSELDCKNNVMYKSKYCYKHRDLSKKL
jgi:Zn-finger nucleic acid-binding protein